MSYDFDEVIKRLPGITFREATRFAQKVVDIAGGDVDFDDSVALSSQDPWPVASVIMRAAEEIAHEDAERERTRKEQAQ